MYTVATLREQLASAWKGLQSPEAVYIANVAGTEVADIVSQYSRANWNREPVFMAVSKNFHGLVNAYEDSRQMGVDRWMALVAGWSAYKDNLCVVDFGTAITVDLVLADGRHLGGYILPGMQLMQDLLNRHTYGIKIDAGESSGINPGRSTSECLGNGARLAVIALIERVVKESGKEYDCDFKCIITGGGADAFRGLLTLPFEHDQDLVLRGMAIVSGDDQ